MSTNLQCPKSHAMKAHESLCKTCACLSRLQQAEAERDESDDTCAKMQGELSDAQAELAKVTEDRDRYRRSLHEEQEGLDASIAINDGLRRELATLRQQLESSPCGVKGHLRLHQKDPQVIYTDGTPSRDLEVVCTACESQRQEREATTAQNKALLDALEERLEVWRNRITSIRVMFPGDQAPIEICADELESLLREHGRLG